MTITAFFEDYKNIKAWIEKEKVNADKVFEERRRIEKENNRIDKEIEKRKKEAEQRKKENGSNANENSSEQEKLPEKTKLVDDSRYFYADWVRHMSGLLDRIDRELLDEQKKPIDMEKLKADPNFKFSALSNAFSQGYAKARSYKRELQKEKKGKPSREFEVCFLNLAHDKFESEHIDRMSNDYVIDLKQTERLKNFYETMDAPVNNLDDIEKARGKIVDLTGKTRKAVTGNYSLKYLSNTKKAITEAKKARADLDKEIETLEEEKFILDKDFANKIQEFTKAMKNADFNLHINSKEFNNMRDTLYDLDKITKNIKGETLTRDEMRSLHAGMNNLRNYTYQYIREKGLGKQVSPMGKNRIDLAVSIGFYLYEKREKAMKRCEVAERTEFVRQNYEERNNEDKKLQELSKKTKYPVTYAWALELDKMHEMKSDDLVFEKLKAEHRKLKELLETNGNPNQIIFQQKLINETFDEWKKTDFFQGMDKKFLKAVKMSGDVANELKVGKADLTFEQEMQIAREQCKLNLPIVEKLKTYENIPASVKMVVNEYKSIIEANSPEQLKPEYLKAKIGIIERHFKKLGSYYSENITVDDPKLQRELNSYFSTLKKDLTQIYIDLKKGGKLANLDRKMFINEVLDKNKDVLDVAGGLNPKVKDILEHIKEELKPENPRYEVAVAYLLRLEEEHHKVRDEVGKALSKSKGLKGKDAAYMNSYFASGMLSCADNLVSAKALEEGVCEVEGRNRKERAEQVKAQLGDQDERIKQVYSAYSDVVITLADVKMKGIGSTKEDIEKGWGKFGELLEKKETIDKEFLTTLRSKCETFYKAIKDKKGIGKESKAVFTDAMKAIDAEFAKRAEDIKIKNEQEQRRKEVESRPEVDLTYANYDHKVLRVELRTFDDEMREIDKAFLNREEYKELADSLKTKQAKTFIVSEIETFEKCLDTELEKNPKWKEISNIPKLKEALSYSALRGKAYLTKDDKEVLKKLSANNSKDLEQSYEELKFLKVMNADIDIEKFMKQKLAADKQREKEKEISDEDFWKLDFEKPDLIGSIGRIDAENPSNQRVKFVEGLLSNLEFTKNSKLLETVMKKKEMPTLNEKKEMQKLIEKAKLSQKFLAHLKSFNGPDRADYLDKTMGQMQTMFDDLDTYIEKQLQEDKELFRFESNVYENWLKTENAVKGEKYIVQVREDKIAQKEREERERKEKEEAEKKRLKAEEEAKKQREKEEAEAEKKRIQAKEEAQKQREESRRKEKGIYQEKQDAARGYNHETKETKADVYNTRKFAELLGIPAGSLLEQKTYDQLYDKRAYLREIAAAKIKRFGFNEKKYPFAEDMHILSTMHAVNVLNSGGMNRLSQEQIRERFFEPWSSGKAFQQIQESAILDLIANKFYDEDVLEIEEFNDEVRKVKDDVYNDVRRRFRLDHTVELSSNEMKRRTLESIRKMYTKQLELDDPLSVLFGSVLERNQDAIQLTPLEKNMIKIQKWLDNANPEKFNIVDSLYNVKWSGIPSDIEDFEKLCKGQLATYIVKQIKGIKDPSKRETYLKGRMITRLEEGIERYIKDNKPDCLKGGGSVIERHKELFTSVYGKDHAKISVELEKQRWLEARREVKNQPKEVVEKKQEVTGPIL